eukprot:TRINITY_DN37861_c0_g1_i1.p1 TRINITY_DN37861_c0_g1~~TRINITY_DN37861_c0_g1_i1.p1  ORF type:complete len:889 (-),score=98.77 TRINITY_DN37861_c0_g1_i1:41-2635(-)
MASALECFPTSMHFAVCCAVPGVVPDNLLLTCPPEYRNGGPGASGPGDRSGHQRGGGIGLDGSASTGSRQGTAGSTSCCDKLVLSAVVKELGRLHPLAIGLGRYDKLVVQALERFATDVDLYNTDVWHSLVITTARLAFAKFDVFTDRWSAHANDALDRPVNGTFKVGRFVRGDTPSGTFSIAALRHLYREASHLSRRFGRVLHRFEAYSQYLMAKNAVDANGMYSAATPDGIRPLFEEPLKMYSLAATRHNYLAHGLLTKIKAALGPLIKKTLPDSSTLPLINLVVAILGNWAKAGFVTLWSMLKHRGRTVAGPQKFRVFVMGDDAGLQGWSAAVEELEAVPGTAEHLDGVEFEYVDLSSHLTFQALKRRWPSECEVTPMGWALLARVLCHEILPSDIERVLALDLGDVLVFDDVADLWARFNDFEEHHMLAAAHVKALHHVNGGVVLYDLSRMRTRNFTEAVLRAARDGAPDCIHDQSVLNKLHLRRDDFGYTGPSPLMVLPCRWHMVPSTEWQLHWATIDMWLPEVVQRQRFPGIVAADWVEVYCPDAIDLMSPWTFLTVTADRQSRIRQMAFVNAGYKQRHCVDAGLGRPEECCQCGRRASLIHIPGDMKQWPGTAALFSVHAPPWRYPPDLISGADQRSLTRGYWLKGEHMQEMARHMRSSKSTQQMSKQLGSQVCYEELAEGCCSIFTREDVTMAASITPIQTVNLAPRDLPILVNVETTAVSDAQLLLGLGPMDSLMIVMGTNDGQDARVDWVRNSVTHNLVYFPQSAQSHARQRGEAHARFWVYAQADGRVEVGHDNVLWGVTLPEFSAQILRSSPVSIYVGTPHTLEATWRICVPRTPVPLDRRWEFLQEGLGPP